MSTSALNRALSLSWSLNEVIHCRPIQPMFVGYRSNLTVLYRKSYTTISNSGERFPRNIALGGSGEMDPVDGELFGMLDDPRDAAKQVRDAKAKDHAEE